jgi:microcompartment protein CcmK/EutM
VVSTIKHPAYHALTLLIVQPEDEKGATVGSSFLAVDRAQSGPGDLVLVMQEGTGVRQLFGEEAFPVRSVILAHVDAVEG